MSSTSEDAHDDKRARRVLSELAFVAPGAVPRSESVDKLTRAASHSVPSSPLKRALSRDDIEREISIVVDLSGSMDRHRREVQTALASILAGSNAEGKVHLPMPHGSTALSGRTAAPF